jgi:hypothetical protein
MKFLVNEGVAVELHSDPDRVNAESATYGAFFGRCNSSKFSNFEHHKENLIHD